jgi:predicted MFS family arabinose efflux permease
LPKEKGTVVANPGEPTKTDMPFARLMGIAISARLLIDTGIQTFNPFLPIIASGLGLDIVTVGRLLGIQNLTGLTSPLLGVLAERHSYRRVMQWSLVAGAIGFLLIGLSVGLWSALSGMLLIGFCVAGFIPTLVAYLSARLPYARRARGLGMLEYSWALAGILGLFAVGQLIERFGWRLPFFGLTVGLLVMAVIFGALPPVQRGRTLHPTATTPDQRRTLIPQFFALGDGGRSAYCAILAGALNFMALMQFNLAYGAWFSDQYGIGPAQLGTVALVLGCLDLCASVSVSLFTDRLGKRRSVLLGGLGALIGFALLPLLNRALIPAVLGLAVTRGFAEFFIVSNISLLSEQTPTQRAKLMTLNVACTQLAITLAGFTGPWIYTTIGITGLAVASSLALAASLIIILLWVREPRTTLHWQNA